MEGNDHKVSLLPDEFAEMVSQIRAVEESIGQATDRELTQGELINRENLQKSLVITQDLSKGSGNSPRDDWDKALGKAYSQIAFTNSRV